MNPYLSDPFTAIVTAAAVIVLSAAYVLYRRMGWAPPGRMFFLMLSLVVGSGVGIAVLHRQGTPVMVSAMFGSVVTLAWVFLEDGFVRDGGDRTR